MLSILIPIYNYDIRPLVQSLVSQADATGVVYELIAYDDGSTLHTHTNSEIATHPCVTYQLLPSNVGRSAIRNLLARAARYPYLLFMDGDSQVVDPQYIAKYLAVAHPHKVVCGGRYFPPRHTIARPYLLHWISGVKREPQPASNEGHFLSNNFLIPKALFTPIGFDERIREYGHEDTLFGLQLAQHHITVENHAIPLLHEGLDNTHDFLAKSAKAAANLAYIARELLTPAQAHTIRLCHTYERIRHTHLLPFVRVGLWLLYPLIQCNLRSSHPSLLALDLFKLYHYSNAYPQK